ncbi:hypothetical protein [Amphiplicatus metriothermophilus]|uniref:FlgN protein n=1 Tax=Amphiplicatus metriothermophilus TaxID=1519374 RepID=A0A239PLA0_9PROT|nr:hypothetical protein [Amphiplicatus metriothermophilus]MBB5517324.1 hypothetical protein [Amphiplicatus metriothermophilus]SNT68340.1 hypothetical protein SAMN06297382_0842 [Amphiplicatus metriothermophilus]
MQTDRTLKDVIEALRGALAEEKRIILEGRYDALGPVAARKESLAEELDRMLLEPRIAAQAPAWRKQIAALAALAKENEAVIDAAKAGVAGARRRINEILSRQRNVGVYGETGEKLLAPGAGVTRQKLA